MCVCVCVWSTKITLKDILSAEREIKRCRGLRNGLCVRVRLYVCSCAWPFVCVAIVCGRVSCAFACVMKGNNRLRKISFPCFFYGSCKNYIVFRR